MQHPRKCSPFSEDIVVQIVAIGARYGRTVVQRASLLPSVIFGRAHSVLLSAFLSWHNSSGCSNVLIVWFYYVVQFKSQQWMWALISSRPYVKSSWVRFCYYRAPTRLHTIRTRWGEIRESTVYIRCTRDKTWQMLNDGFVPGEVGSTMFYQQSLRRRVLPRVKKNSNEQAKNGLPLLSAKATSCYRRECVRSMQHFDR